MDSSDYDDKIARAQDEIDQHQQRMHTLKARFIRAAAEYASAIFETTVDNRVKMNPGVTQQLGIHRLRELKTRLRALQEDAIALSEKYLGPARLWVHEASTEERSKAPHSFNYMVVGKHPPALTNSGVEELLGAVGPLLNDFGFLRQNEKASGRIYFSEHWTEEMLTLMKEYSEMHVELEQRLRNLSQVMLAKEQAIAADLWEQA